MSLKKETKPYCNTDVATAWKNYGWSSVNSISCFTYAYVNIVFSRWDIATEVHELVY